MAGRNNKYQVECNLKGRHGWFLVKPYSTYKDALDHVRREGGGKYKLRIVRVTRTVMFEDKS